MEPRDPSKGKLPMTGEAIKQHLAKIRDHRIAEGRRVPPKLSRGARRSAAALQAIAHPLADEAKRIYGSGGAQSRAKGSQAKAENTAQPRKSTLLAETTASRRKAQQQKAKVEQKKVATEQKAAGTGVGTKRGATKRTRKQQSAAESTGEVEGGNSPTGTWQLRPTEPKNYAETPTDGLEQTGIKDEDHSDDEPLVKKAKRAHGSTVKPKSGLLNDTVHRWNNRDPFSSSQKDYSQLGSHSHLKVSKGLPSAFIDTSLGISLGSSLDTSIGHAQAPYPIKPPSAGYSVQQGSECYQYPRPLPIALTPGSEPSNYFGSQPSSISYNTIMQNLGGANSSFMKSPTYGTSPQSYSDPSYSSSSSSSSFALSQTSLGNNSTSTSFSSSHDGGAMMGFNAMPCNSIGNHIGSDLGPNIVPQANSGQGGRSINLTPNIGGFTGASSNLIPNTVSPVNNDQGGLSIKSAPNGGGFASASSNLGPSDGDFAGLPNFLPTTNGYAIPYNPTIGNDGGYNDLPSNDNSANLGGLPLPLSNSGVAPVPAYSNGIQDQAQPATSPAFSSDEPVFGKLDTSVSQAYDNCIDTGTQDQAQPATLPAFSSDEPVFGNFNTAVSQAYTGPDSVPRSVNAPVDPPEDDFHQFFNAALLESGNDVSFTLPEEEHVEGI